MSNELKIGFIGFGEAGFNLAKGLRDAAVAQLFAYDINTRTPGLGEKIQRRAEESATRLLDSSEDLAHESDILLSVVTSDAAAEAATQSAPFLAERHLYVDLNSVSPARKQTVERIIADGGARFVEASIMAAVKTHGHRVPILLGGTHAHTLSNLLTPYGMRFEVVSDQVGAAAAVKMCRSIVIKGLESLLFECALGASCYGAEERVFASLDESLPGIDWAKLAGYMMGRVIEHGERRAREMEEAAETLRAAGVEPIMAEAAARRQEWVAQLNLLAYFGGKAPDGYQDVMRAIAGPLGKAGIRTSDNALGVR